MIGKNMKVGAAVFGLALGGGLLAGSVIGAPGSTSAASTGVVAAAVVGDSTDSTASTDSTDSTTSTDSAAPAAPVAETPLEGDVAAQVTAAAQAAIPDGTIDRVETDSDGVYEAHVTKADGTKVIVQIGADFTVTETIDQPRGGGHGGPGAGETPLEGDVAAQVTAAAQAAIPDGTVDRVETDSDGSPYEAHVTNADGTQVVLKIDESFTVTATEDMPAPGQGGPHGDRQAPPAADPSATSDTTAG